MATTATSRATALAQEQRSVAAVEEQIRSTIRPPRSRYLQEFQNAFRRYESVLSAQDMDRALHASSLTLIGDYHSLEACQDFVAATIKTLAASRSEVVLCLEAFYSLDQPALDAWSRGEISLETLRRRTEFDKEWSYDWWPYEGILTAARERSIPVYGIDCRPRFDLRRVRSRDRHAASRLARIRKIHPSANLVVVVGESHLAPSHLPRRVQKALPGERMLTVLQNIDALYWQAAAEPSPVSAVRVSESVACAFTSTPLQKYESYCHYLEQCGQD